MTSAGLFVASLLWYFCAQVLSQSAATGLAQRFGLVDGQPLLASLLLLFLLICGFMLLRAIERRRSPLGLTLLFLTAMSWFLCSWALSGNSSGIVVNGFDVAEKPPLTGAMLLLFVLICGFALLRAVERQGVSLRVALGLPKRATVREEWVTGAAIGWGLAVASVLPMVLAHALNAQLWTSPRAFWLCGLSLVALAVATLAHTLAIYGYGFQRLIQATGPARATVVLVALAAIHAGFTPTAQGTPDATRIIVEMLATLLLCLCWLRTHGLWLPWGLHFAWAASTGVLFGLPLGGDASFSSVVDSRAGDPLWLTGGVYGPTAATFSIFLLIAAVPILIRVTSDYAWNYTHPPIIPAGYDVSIAPPAAHVAMEQGQAAQPAKPTPLVQILPAPAPEAPRDGTAE